MNCWFLRIIGGRRNNMGNKRWAVVDKDGNVFMRNLTKANAEVVITFGPIEILEGGKVVHMDDLEEPTE